MGRYTDKKEKEIFLIYKEIQKGGSCKVIQYEEGLSNSYEEMRKYLVMYEKAFSHVGLCNCYLLKFLIYEENFLFFISVGDFDTIKQCRKFPEQITCKTLRDFGLPSMNKIFFALPTLIKKKRKFASYIRNSERSAGLLINGEIFVHFLIY
jgi:hypothetical protein